MARPLRVEFSGAFYHLMVRSQRGRSDRSGQVFKDLPLVVDLVAPMMLSEQ
jgi:hypothetical protein